MNFLRSRLIAFVTIVTLNTLAHSRINLASESAFGILAFTGLSSTGEIKITGQIAIYPNERESFPLGTSGPIGPANSFANSARATN
jgi:hypothetical protein